MAGPYLQQTQEQRLQMVLAPQLRQSLELLQVPILELRTLIQQEIEQNPTIEETPIETTQVEVESTAEEKEAEDTKELDFKEEFEILARLDDEWKEYFQQNKPSKHSTDDAAKRQYFLDSLSQEMSLQEHLQGQLALTEFNEQERQIAELIVGSVNDDGYLASTLEELAESTGFELEEVERILAIIQEFDPIGVCARDLRECLLIQLQRFGMENSHAAILVQNHLGALGTKKFPEIARLTKIPVEEVQEAAQFISTLEPKPGRLFASDAPPYVLPEIIVQKVEGKYIIMLNDDQIPHLRISKNYRQLMKDPAATREVKSYIRDKVRAGSFLIKSIDQRQQTIRRIANEIVKVQQSFLEEGVSQLKPLTMAEVADVLGIHETTVSRAIANKYMQTPRGTYELKYFFTPGFKTEGGKNISNKTIKDEINHLVTHENAASPLSDQAMVEKLKEKGIKVARRTIAKYREELRILPSHMRKTY